MYAADEGARDEARVRLHRNIEYACEKSL
jgi:hypothetical protein